MTNMPAVRPQVVAAKQRLIEGHRRIYQRHREGTPGIQVAAALADLSDGIVLDLFEAALNELDPELRAKLIPNIALVPNGGFGRRDMSPYSDIDLMLLFSKSVEQEVTPLAVQLFRDLGDVGWDVGNSARTPRVACRLARGDATICTSLVESRYLAGSVKLYSRFMRRFTRMVHRRRRTLLAAMEASRLAERAKYGETVYLLEPNVKRTRGGLRELHLLRWLGFARYGTAEPDDLRLRGVLSRADTRKVRQTTEFLLHLRNEMHFHAGKRSDGLDQAEQMRIAEVFGFQGDDGMLPVEQFMREYFRHTNQLARIVSRVATGARPELPLRETLGALVSRRMERDFRVGPRQISVRRRGLPKLRGQLEEVLRLADLANHSDKSIAYTTTEAIRPFMRRLPQDVSTQAAKRFLDLLDKPIRLGETLRWLYDLGVLEILLPAFKNAHGLLQFNVYHKYTVDEHCLRAVESAVRLAKNQNVLGTVYRMCDRKYLLFLALLLHDLGKGKADDHSQVGERIALETAARLRLSRDDTETLRFLVRNHLLMSPIAFRGDVNDERVVVSFAAQCGSPAALRLLFLMTAADLDAVGPKVWTGWKEELLEALYRRTIMHLADECPEVPSDVPIDALRRQVQRLVEGAGDKAWFAKQIAELPISWFRPPAEVSPAQVAAELRDLYKLDHGEVTVRGRYLAESGTVEFTVGTYEEIVPGVFHRLTGALASHGLEVLQADIHTLADGLILDRFYVNDPDFDGPPSEDRLMAVKQSLEKSLLKPTDGPPRFRTLWQHATAAHASCSLPRVPARVRIDNHSSRHFTMIEVFARDQPGLLYMVSRKIFELRLSVSMAKIGTSTDQVVDVFYVTQADNGSKVESPERRDQICHELLASLETFERE